MPAVNTSKQIETEVPSVNKYSTTDPLNFNSSTESFSEVLADELGYSSTSTYVSTPATLIDLPEPTDFKSEFFYNYYTRDERTVSTGESTIVDINSSAQDIEFIKKQNRMPRSVILKIRSAPPTSLIATSFLKSFAEEKVQGKYIFNNRKKIVFEGAVANSRFSTVILHDNQIDDTFYNQITGSIAFDESYSKSDTHSQFMSDLCTKYYSPMTRAAQSPSTLRKAMSNVQPNGVAYADSDARVEIIAEALRDVRYVEFGFSINHAVIANMAMGSVEDMGNIYQDELLGIQSVAKSIQQHYVSETSPSVVDSSDFELEMAPIDSFTKEYITSKGYAINESSFPIGYYIEKTEITSDKNENIVSKEAEPIIIENYGDFNIFDSDIKYGATYIYKCKIIYLTAYEATAIDQHGETPDETVFAISLIASSGIKTQVSALENIPPPPPQNLRFNYNFYDDGLDIFWEEPTNPQRDVVRYQVFRRESTSQSFVLLAELDFDMSTSRVVPLEKSPKKKIIKVRGPRKIFKDRTFTKDREYIYAMASIDARGLTSPYSEQITVRFDKFKNKIKRNRISAPGAPKSYPNLYLKGDLFVDSMNSSNATRMRVFFDPEYYKLVTTHTVEQGTEKDGFKTSTVESSLNLLADKYKIQMINLDLQNAQTFDISIKDETGPPLDVPMTSATIKSIF